MNITPKSKADVTTLAFLALAGAEAHGDAVRLRHNSALHLRADLFALCGDPNSPEVPGAQARLDAQLRLMRETYAALQTVLRAARTFCFVGFGMLRPQFGQRWNGTWQAAGFNQRSLSVPALPLSLLTEFRAFLVGNPSASVEYGFTAEDAQRHIEAIQSATVARENARGGRWSIQRERDLAFRKLRKRLSNLRAELSHLLSPTDDRWSAFGFRRPADGRQPEPMRELTVTQIHTEAVEKSEGPSSHSDPENVAAVEKRASTAAVSVTWRHSRRAENYRVSWRLASAEAGEGSKGGGESIDELPRRSGESRITADPRITLVDLPANVQLVISVSARNATGETRPAELETTFAI